MSNVKLHPCGHCLRLTLILWNIFVLLVGLAAFGVGVWQVVENNNYRHLVGDENASGAIVSIVAGLVAVGVAMLGIVAAIALSRILLGLYAMIVVLFIILELVSGILGFVFRDNVESTAEDNALDAISDYYNSSRSRDVVDTIQDDFECCGWNNYTDWDMDFPEGKNFTFPESCTCNDDDDDGDHDDDDGSGDTDSDCVTVNDQRIYSSGCRDSVVDAFREYLLVVGAIGIVFAVIQIAVVAIAIILCGCVHKAKGEYTTV